MIRDSWKTDDSNFDGRRPCVQHQRVQHRGVLLWNTHDGQKRKYPQHRDGGALLQKAKAGFEQRNVTAKLVDQKSLDSLPLGGGQQLNRAHQGCEHTSSVDVSDQDNRSIREFSNRPVNQVAIAQVDFRSTTGAFDDYQIEFV